MSSKIYPQKVLLSNPRKFPPLKLIRYTVSYVQGLSCNDNMLQFSLVWPDTYAPAAYRCTDYKRRLL